ncbi:glycosyltransferase family 4 protein [Legionella sp. CNM-4043-24]|uniref:glycosyltransferase family 4 protein n=1 Tax=Legionella sp. CNM-4043-24 TaxID=3421646 RepID=UPI00403AEC24
MSQQVIWYLHHYAGAPSLGMSYRPYYLSREFARQGCQSWVIGAGFHHLLHSPVEQREPVRQETIDGQNYLFLKTPAYHGNTPKRFINMLTYAWNLWRYRKKLLAITGVPSVIIVSSAHPFHYFAARRIARQYKARLIFEVRDLWPMSLIELMNVSPSNPVVHLLNHIEKQACREADYVVSLLPYALEHMAKRGLSAERFVYIPNGVAPDDLAREQEAIPEAYQQLILEKKQRGQLLVGYTGAHGVPNSLDDLLQALIRLQEEGFQDVHFFLVGDGRQKQALQDLARVHRLSSVTFLDKLPKKQIASFLQSMDAVYLGWKNKPLYRYGISPNKLFDYLLAAKPVLQAFSAPNDLIRETSTGITVEAENPVAIAEGIKALTRIPQEELQSMGRRGKELVLSQFTYDRLGKQYQTLFEAQ